MQAKYNIGDILIHNPSTDIVIVTDIYKPKDYNKWNYLFRGVNIANKFHLEVHIVDSNGHVQIATEAQRLLYA